MVRQTVALLAALLALAAGGTAFLMTRHSLGESPASDAALEPPPHDELVTAPGFDTLPGEVKPAAAPRGPTAPGPVPAGASSSSTPSPKTEAARAAAPPRPAAPRSLFSASPGGLSAVAGPTTSAAAGAQAPAAHALRPMPRLQPMAWLHGTTDVLSQTAALDRRIAEVARANAALEARIARLTGQGTARAPVSELPPGVQYDADGQPVEQEGPDLPGAPAVPGAGPGAPAGLAAAQDELREGKSLLAQYRSAGQQFRDATLGSEANYQALLRGDVAHSGGFYARRAALDAETKTTIIPAGPCGDYPQGWCGAPPDSVIRFGGKAFLNRECVAYAAWERWRNGRSFATVDAGDWPGDSAEPAVGSVAIWNRNTVSRYGHVAYVTAVGPDSIMVSEFNWYPWVHSNRVIKRRGRGWPSRFWR